MPFASITSCMSLIARSSFTSAPLKLISLIRLMISRALRGGLCRTTGLI
jgi:hypothetical protein